MTVVHKVYMTIAGVVIAIATVPVSKEIIKRVPSFKEITPEVYFEEFTEGQINVIHEDVRVGMINPVLETSDGIFVSYEFVSKYVSDRVFFDEEEMVLTITTLNDVIRIRPDENVAWVTGEEKVFENKLMFESDKLYLPIEYIDELGVEMGFGKDGMYFVSHDTTVAKDVYKAKHKTVLRTHPNHKASIVQKVSKNEKLLEYGESGEYYRVKSESGLVGYVKKADVKYIETTPVTEQVFLPAPKSPNLLQEPVRMAWDQIGAYRGNMNEEKYKNVEKLNVISPSWLEFNSDLGELKMTVSKEYIEAANERGIQVWPMLAQNFAEPQYTKSILTSTQSRQFVIEQLLAYADMYGVQGFNIDIENIQPEFSREWIQFLRELYPQLNKKGLIVSVDIYAPSPWSTHYQREAVSEVVDYFMVMAYDQHWSGSEEAGPVASLPWTEEAIANTLKEVPAEKLVLGMPTYTRMWAETPDGLETRAYGMDYIKNRVSGWGVEPGLDEKTQMDYAETIIGEKRYRVWIENAESIGRRLELVEKYNLAGFSMWKLGLESEDVWGKIE